MLVEQRDHLYHFISNCKFFSRFNVLKVILIFLTSYEERSRSLETISTRHKENSTFEEFAARIFNPIQPQSSTSSSNVITTAAAPLASALIDHHRSSTKSK